jgi:D-alanyl-D-alanine carboxypeptidase
MIHKLARDLAAFVLFAALSFAAAQAATLDATVAAQSHPTAMFITGAGVSEPHGAAAGDAGPGQTLTADTPLRIASNTKTFVAASVLRLWEQGRIDLDAPIGPLLTPALDALLRDDGYATDRITVRQLLSHSAGLYDHGGDPRFIQAVLADRSHVWTREELVRLSMTYADPQSAPGTEFRYSDTGYILLGDIVERITGQSIGRSVRELIGFDRLGLHSTWWEVMEPAPAGVLRRAHQSLGDVDATDVHASMDLYGGGGLLMSTRDLATAFAAIFDGRVFERPETLREMLWQGPHRGAEGYRLGVFVKQVGGRELYWHSGFWGTHVYYAPDSRVAVAGMTTNQDAYRRLASAIEAAVIAAPGESRE